MKTIKYELAKKLYDTGTVIESETSFFFENNEWEEGIYIWKSEKKDQIGDLWFSQKICPAPNCEEVIEFLSDIKIDNFHLSIDFCSWLTIVNYRSSGSVLFPYIEEPTLLEALEATLEYLLDNWFLWKQ